MSITKTNIPRLRFTEFGGEWKKRHIKDLFFINAGGDVKVENVSPVKTEKFMYPIYANAEKRKGLYGYSDLYKVEGETLTIAGRGVNIGIAHARNEKYFPIVRLLVLKPRNKEVVKFHEYQFNRQNIFIESTGVPQLTSPQISSYSVFKPSFDEQQEIATFLTSVDTKIEQLTKKKSLLEQYKKGVMQQIFSQHLRFKDENGNDYPDWEEKKLGEIATKSSSNISANTIEENTGKYKIYGAAGLLKCVDFYREKVKYISIVKDGAGVGRTLLCDAYSSVLGTLDIIKPKTNAILYFIYSLINNIDFTKYITGSTIPHIYFKDYSKEKIRIPCIEEQTQITNFLSSIDTKIELVNTQIGNTQKFKKGLLQQMFV